MDKTLRIQELISKLSDAATAYYKYDDPIMSDKQYDGLYDELEALEKETGIIYSNSPTRKVQGEVLDGLVKVKHSKPMLSAAKTKDINEIKKFIGNEKCVLSWKEDGLTIVIRYKNGIFQQAITRGSGELGEDVTHTVKMFKNVPMKLKYCTDIEVRGEGLISWSEFNRINETLEEQYSHPRNLASGSVRQLDSNVTKQRNLEFKAFELVQDNMNEYDFYHQGMDKYESLEYLSDCGFDVVEHEIVTRENVEEIINKYNPENYKFPVDGLIIEINDRFKAKELGSTSHHDNRIMALKWKDETYETTLENIEWNTSRTGLINPVAIFSPVDLEGAITTRATLHNISYMEDLQLGIGDTITVYRANKVIPKVDDNLTRSNSFSVPDKCPTCGGDAEIHNDNGSMTLHCINPSCSAKLISRLAHFVSKHAMNIDGMSEASIEKFVELGWLNSLYDIYKLKDHRLDMMCLDGFGKKSVEKLLLAIEDSKNVNLENFIYALGIPQIGRNSSKIISKKFNGDWFEFEKAILDDYDFSSLEDFGETTNRSIHKWHNKVWVSSSDDKMLSIVLNFIKPETITKSSSNSLQGKSICITGKLIHYSNRDALVVDIINNGGKEASGVTSKTGYLLTNDTTSGSSKNKKAAELGIPIITEEDFMKMINKL